MLNWGVRALHPYRHQRSTKSSGRLADRPHRPHESLMTLNLLSCFNPRCNQTDIVHSGLMAKVDDLGDIPEIEILIALDEHDLLLAARNNLRQLGFEVFLCERCFVDQIRRRSCSIRTHLHNNRTRVLRLFLMLLWRLRNERLQPSRRHRNDDHKDDQQHQKNVDKRCYVNVGNCSAGISSTHSHSNSPKIRWPSQSFRAGILPNPNRHPADYFFGVVVATLSSTLSVSKPSWLTPAERIPSTASITLP